MAFLRQTVNLSCQEGCARPWRFTPASPHGTPAASPNHSILPASRGPRQTPAASLPCTHIPRTHIPRSLIPRRQVWPCCRQTRACSSAFVLQHRCVDRQHLPLPGFLREQRHMTATARCGVRRRLWQLGRSTLSFQRSSTLERACDCGMLQRTSTILAAAHRHRFMVIGEHEVERGMPRQQRRAGRVLHRHFAVLHVRRRDVQFADLWKRRLQRPPNRCPPSAARR
jgi:hypothetical protein